MKIMIAAVLVGLAAAGATPTTARAEPYTILVYETQADFALRAESSDRGQAYWTAWNRFAETLKAAGAIRSGAALESPQQGRVLKAGGRATAAEASPSDSALNLGGFFVIEATNLDAALELAAQAQSVSRGGAAEVRGVYAAPGMAR